MTLLANRPAVRKTRKVNRALRLALPPFEGNPGVLTITTGHQEVDYYLTELPADFGRAFELSKFFRSADELENYHVNLNGNQSSCECMGFPRHGHCKHVAGLQVLVNQGKLPGRKVEAAVA